MNKDKGKVWLYGDDGDSRVRNIYVVDFETLEHKVLFNELTTDLTYAFRFEGEPIVGVSIRSATESGEEIVVQVRSDINLGEYYICNTKTNKVDLLWANRTWIDVEQMNPMKPVRIIARDGLELNGYLKLPKGVEKAPIVVPPHGGPIGVRDYWMFDSEVQLLTSRGYGVLQLNYRGGSGYGALMTVAREPELFQCAIGYVGVYDLSDLFTERFYEKLNNTEAYFMPTKLKPPGRLCMVIEILSHQPYRLRR